MYYVGYGCTLWGLCYERPYYVMMCSITLVKFSDVIHPEKWTCHSEPSGAPVNMNSLKFFLGKIKTGGNALPEAEIMQHIVTNSPLSREVTWPTCLVPRVARTLGTFWTVVKPVSSRLKIWAPDTFSFTKESFNKVKKHSTLCLIKISTKKSCWLEHLKAHWE